MPASLIAVWVVTAACAAIGAAFGGKPDAPLIVRWPCIVWDWIAHSRRRAPSMPERPDYDRIDSLERELGLVEDERPIGNGRTVCLTKGCAGETVDIRTWAGQLATRLHTCEAP